jgi:hypothetical protein
LLGLNADNCLIKQTDGVIMSDILQNWTESLVEERLAEAADTLIRLPSRKIQGYFGVWPQIKHDVSEIAEWEALAVRRGPPTPQAIDRMDDSLPWLRWLTVTERRVVWLRANKVGWKIVCARIGRRRTVAWNIWVFALAKIAYRLNDRAIIARTRISQGQSESQFGLGSDSG